MNFFTNWKLVLLNVCINIIYFGFQNLTILKQQQKNNGFKVIILNSEYSMLML